jgi:hypothetical protein
MGEQDLDLPQEIDESCFPIFGDLTLRANWLDDAEELVVQNLGSPYANQARDCIHKMRDINEELGECSIQRQFLEKNDPLTTLYSYQPLEDMEREKEQIEELDRRESQLIAKMYAKSGTIDMYVSRVKNWSLSSSETKEETVDKFSLKYHQRTFTYKGTSRDLLPGRSFASFCHLFYTTCPKSGKKAWKDLLDQLKLEQPDFVGADREQVRQWIRDFNRWIKGKSFGFGDRISGPVLRLRGDYVERVR